MFDRYLRHNNVTNVSIEVPKQVPADSIRLAKEYEDETLKRMIGQFEVSGENELNGVVALFEKRCDTSNYIYAGSFVLNGRRINFEGSVPCRKVTLSRLKEAALRLLADEIIKTVSQSILQEFSVPVMEMVANETRSLRKS